MGLNVMTGAQLKRAYVDFFVQRDHAEIPQAPLLPENDPTVLFTTAGMHPLVPYLLGEPHPAGKRLVDCQRCIRTGDVDQVGDDCHLTLFEMLGNWSLGDYWKDEAIRMSYDFLTQVLGMEPDRLSVSVFAGDKDVPKDEDAVAAWKEVGIPDARIYALPKTDNWWGPAGQTGPCGPDTEMFYDMGKPACGASCCPGCKCGKYVEIWNDVFMQYNKTAEGTYQPLAQRNVDTGLGVERVATILQGKSTLYETDLFLPLMEAIRSQAQERDERSERVIADHLRAGVFILAERVAPSNLGQGYVLRRLVRRAIRFGRNLKVKRGFLAELAPVVVDGFEGQYSHLGEARDFILSEVTKEERRFQETIGKGLKELNKAMRALEPDAKSFSGAKAFYLYETLGFPVEMTQEILSERFPDAKIDMDAYEKAYAEHQDKSRAGAEATFKGGLADSAEATTALHTATHLLHQALVDVLGEHVAQRGSNITGERLRFDFSHPQKMTPEEKAEVERIVNEKIDADLPVTMTLTSVEDAKARGARALFADKYGEKVKLYAIGDYSLELCGGPHVERTGALGRFKIKKEEASSAGVRRIKAVLRPKEQQS
jgi:alanyl-tRNA synthetase